MQNPSCSSQYDKIIKENMNEAMPDILIGIFGIQAARAEDLAEYNIRRKEFLIS